MGQPVVYFEIGCKDRERTSRFFGELFDWTLTTQQGSLRSDIATGGKGIQGHLVSLGHEPHDYVMIYAEVDNLEHYLARAESLGGKKVIGPIPISTGRFAWFTDPEGNMLGLLEPSADEKAKSTACPTCGRH